MVNDTCQASPALLTSMREPVIWRAGGTVTGTGEDSVPVLSRTMRVCSPTLSRRGPDNSSNNPWSTRTDRDRLAPVVVTLTSANPSPLVQAIVVVTLSRSVGSWYCTVAQPGPQM